MSDGTFPKASVRRLHKIGEWLYVNGEAIYGANPSPFKGPSPEWGFITCKKAEGNIVKIYLHVVNWPEARELVVNGILEIPDKVYLLETGQQLMAVPHPETALTIHLPYEPIDKNITVIVLELDNNISKILH